VSIDEFERRKFASPRQLDHLDELQSVRHSS
jgi:hypothetical protein